MKNIRIFTFFILISLVFCLSPADSFAADSFSSGPIHYTVDSSGNATITEYDSGEENVVIPESIDGYPVVAIGPRAFYEDTVIKTVSLPEGLITISERAFDSCSNIEQLNIPSTVRTLGTSSFTHLKITELTLPEGMTEIPYHCFAYCNKLTDVHLPSTLKKIGGYGFFDCSSLTNIDLPEGLTTIDENAFDSCYAISWETLPDGVETINYATLYYVNPASGVFTFSGNVKTLKEYKFYKCKKFNFMGETAPAVPNLSLDKSYTIHIRPGASGFNTKPWTNANIVRDLTPPVENGEEQPTSPIHYTVDSSGNATITEYDSGEENVVIPESSDGHPVVAIGPRAFYEDTVIKTVSLPEGLTTISERAFASCSNIEQINIPSTVRTLGTSSFTHLKITELTLPEGITEIPYHCFAYCNKLTDVHLPSTLKKIGGYGFVDCSSLTNIDLPEGLTTIDENAFDSCYAISWETLPDGVETINYATLYYVNPASGVFTFSKNVKTIKEYEFYKCKEFAFNGYTAPSVPNLRLSKDYTIHIREGATGFDSKPWTNANIVADVQPCSEHVWDSGNTTQKPTCTKEGEIKYTCKVCGEIKTEVLPKTDHIFNTEFTVDKPATCSDDGSQSIHCSICGVMKEDSVTVIPAIGHNWGEPVYTWSKDNSSVTAVRTCRNDSTHKESETVSTTSEVTKAATYSEKGKTTYTAVFTNEVFTDQTKTVSDIPALERTSISSAKVSNIAAKVYTGKALTQAPTVKVGTKTLKSGTDYKLTYKNNKNVGKATVTITGIGAYKGTISKSFKINPKGTSLKTLTKSSKAATIKWTKQATKMSSSRITGYQIQLATDSKFTKNKKTVTVKGYSKVSKKVTGLKGGKKYYVRIRTYKTVSGTNYYSSWSKAKTVTTKK